MPQGLDSIVEQGGTNFSGVAKTASHHSPRAAKRSANIDFDDSTSAVDMDTDAKIRAPFDTELQGNNQDHSCPAHRFGRKRRPHSDPG